MKTDPPITLILMVLLMAPFPLLSQDKEPTKEEALVTVRTMKTDSTAMANEEVIFTDQESGEEFKGITGADGTFKILLPKGSKYEVAYKTLKDQTQYSNMELPEARGRMTSELTITYEPPRKYVLRNVHFETGSAALKPSSHAALDQVVDFMERKSDTRIEVAGHTDSQGNPEDNMQLSRERARAVVDYLVEQDIERSRMVPKGYGEERPIASNDTQEGRQKNRRTEVEVLEGY